MRTKDVMMGALFFVCCLWTVSCGRSFTEVVLSGEGSLPPLVFAGEGAATAGVVEAGSYIVAFRTGIRPAHLIRRQYERESQSHYFRLARLSLFEKGVKDLHYLTAFDLSSFDGGDSFTGMGGPSGMDLTFGGKREPQPASIVRVDFDNEKVARKILSKWMADGLLYYAEPNYASKPFGGETSFGDYAETYGQLSERDSLTKIGIIDAFNAMNEKGVTFNNPPLIAVMDSGLDYEHPAISDNIWTNPVPGVSGCGNDLYGCNATAARKGTLGDGDVFPVGLPGPGDDCQSANVGRGDCIHGTHVAGLLAGEPSEEGARGVCPVCRILTVRIVGPDKTSKKDDQGRFGAKIVDSSIIAGFTYLSRFVFSDGNAVRVVNASFGKFQRSRTVERLIRLMKNSGNGILVVAAAGNDDSMKRTYPAAFSDALAVVNVFSDSTAKDPTSNFGPWTDIAAPGAGDCNLAGQKGLLSIVPGGGADCAGGTSMASPVVAGVAGLLLAAEPSLTIDELRSRLLLTANPDIYFEDENIVYIPKVKGEPNPIPLLGTGLVNADNAIRNNAPAQRPRPSFNRVGNNCGALKQTAKGAKLPFVLLALPLVFVFWGARFKRILI